MRNPARERSRNLNREVWESPSVYGGEDVNNHCLTSRNRSHRQFSHPGS
ncbi:MAG: hypothetical protein GPJ09_18655 [Microcystis aeruginosa SX13-01]|nr:hypothetical protein [Microcystis aeruginosa SX13-01]